MARYALTRNSDGVVVNLIEWDGVTSYTPPEGLTNYTMRPATYQVQVGSVWNGAAFTGLALDVIAG